MKYKFLYQFNSQLCWLVNRLHNFDYLDYIMYKRLCNLPEEKQAHIFTNLNFVRNIQLLML